MPKNSVIDCFTSFRGSQHHIFRRPTCYMLYENSRNSVKLLSIILHMGHISFSLRCFKISWHLTFLLNRISFLKHWSCFCFISRTIFFEVCCFACLKQPLRYKLRNVIWQPHCTVTFVLLTTHMIRIHI